MKICEICGKTEKEGRISNSEKYKMTLCWKHYMQMRQKGKILKRTKYDPNEIIIHKDYAEIILYSGRSEQTEIARTKIDLEDVEKCRGYKWRLEDNNYPIAKINKKQMYLHRFVMNNPKNKEVDHIKHNTLDNRKGKLRIATRQQNQMNRKKSNNTSSEYKGVYWDNRKKKWSGNITYQQKRVYLGMFNNE